MVFLDAVAGAAGHHMSGMRIDESENLRAISERRSRDVLSQTNFLMIWRHKDGVGVSRPEPYERVLVWTGAEVTIGCFNEEGDLYSISNGWSAAQPATYWMELPEPP